MAIHDFSSQRLFVEHPLSAGTTLNLTVEQSHYLVHVLRLKLSDGVLVFNGVDGEWSATLAEIKKRSASLMVMDQTREQSGGPDIQYLFAPLKRARLDYMVQKATELGVAVLQPVTTRRTVAERVNLDRMRANAIEAAEQCGILRLPTICPVVAFEALLRDWKPERRIIFCDETAETADPIASLKTLQPGPLAVFIGPEGGFTPDEREQLLSQPFVHALSLGPRIMRADTAAIAALSVVSAVAGYWSVCARPPAAASD